MFAAALAVRLATLLSLESVPLFRSPQLDSLEYLLRAQRIAAGDFRFPNPPAHGPGYPFVLGSLLRLFGGSLEPVRMVQILAGALLAVAVGAWTARLFDRSSGLAAGLLVALSGPLAWVESSLYAEGLLLLLMVSAILAASYAPRPLAAAAAAGLLLGLATTVRPTAVALLPALALWCGTRETGRGRVRNLAVMAAFFLLPLVPVAVANQRATGAFIPVQAHGGMNFYLGNSPSGTGLASARPGAGWDALEGEARRQGFEKASDQDRYYIRKTRSEIARAPLRYAGLLARKALWLVQDEEVRDTHSYRFFVGFAPFLRFLPGFGILLGLAAAGAFVASTRRPRPWPLFVAVAGVAASCLFLVVGTRYRLPLVPLLAPLSGLAVADGLRAAKRRDSRRIAGLAAAAVAAYLVSRARTHAESRVFAEEWSLTGDSLARENRLEEAEDAFRRALQEDPGSGPALDGIGRMRVERGDWVGAEDAFRQSIARGESQRARLHLGLVLERRGRPEEALSELRKAASLRPDDPTSLEALGRVLLGLGRADEAAAAYRGALERQPENAAAHLGLARIAWGRRDFREASERAARATSLSPSDPEGWLILAMISLEAGRADRAAPAIEKAAALAPGAPPVELARALLERLRGRRDSADAILRPLVARAPGYAPAARLFLQNAREMGREAEARKYLEGLSAGR